MLRISKRACRIVHCLSRWWHIYRSMQKLPTGDITCTPFILNDSMLDPATSFSTYLVVLLLEISLLPSFILSVRGRDVDTEELLSPSLSPPPPPPTSSFNLDLCFLWWFFLCFFLGLPYSLLLAEEQKVPENESQVTSLALVHMHLVI